jgi:type III restriction enzyme
MTEGYDIPRACALFQIRDTESGTLDEQVLGRIRRNPILKDWEEYYNADGTESEANKLAVTAYA